MTSDDRAFTSPRFCGSSIPTSRLRPRRASEMRGGARRPQIPSAIFWLTYISSFAAPATPPSSSCSSTSLSCFRCDVESLR